MVKELVFHLGDRKAGSTSIQEALSTQSWNCPDLDVLYTAKINHMPLAESLYNKRHHPIKNWFFAQKNPFFMQQAKLLSRSTADIAVFSAEAFESVRPHALKSALKTYLPEYLDSARFIAYVRPHADRLVSDYAEGVKQGAFSGSLEEFHKLTLKRRPFFYHDRFKRWRHVFGKQFELRPMIRSELAQNDVVYDFFSYLLKGAPFTLTGDTASNPSLSLEDLSMVREFHQSAFSGNKSIKVQNATGWEFANILSATKRQNPTKVALHESMVPSVIETYAQDAKDLDATFFSGSPMTNALYNIGTKATKTAQSVAQEDHFSPDELRMNRAWAQLAAQLIKMQPDDLPGHFRKLHIAKQHKKP